MSPRPGVPGAAGEPSGGASVARWEGGQAAVELALVLPLVLWLAMVVVQVALVARDQVLVTTAAREAAREAAVDADPAAVRGAAVAGTRLDRDRLAVDVGPRGAPGTRVEVVVRYRARTEVPLVGALVPDVELSDAAVMRVER